MKIVEWFKILLSRIRKKDYMLKERNMERHEQKGKKDFVQKVDVNAIKTREDILRSITEEIIVEDLSEQYDYTKFSPENIRKEYDMDSILSDEDMTALSCLYGAIKEGNMEEFKTTDNKINTFLKEKPNNIVELINLMIKDAKSLYESLISDDKIHQNPTSIQGLIAGSYDDISEIIKKYNEQNQLAIGE